MIKSGLENIKDKVEIDLSGPDGNVFVLMNTAKSWAKKIGADGDAIIQEMMSGDYDNAVEVFDREFGEFCILYKPLNEVEREIVSGAEEIQKKRREEEKKREVYEVVCNDNTGIEDSFEVGVIYRVIDKNAGKGIYEVEDMNGDVVEVLRDRFGDLIKTEVEDNGCSFKERVDVLKRELYVGITNEYFNELLDGIKEVYYGENLKDDIRERMGAKAYSLFEKKFVEVMLELM